MTRCTKCILPDSFPGIAFDENGVCNYCRGHVKAHLFDREEELSKILDEHRGRSGDADCIVPYSGGRDSTYLLLRLVRDFGIRPVAVTYDWGMMTPEAQRNWANMSKALDVEHVIIRGDVDKIKRHVRSNIKAWLRKPELGMVPIFMMADKVMGYHINRLAKRRGIGLAVKGVGNPYETTTFKSGFLGVTEVIPQGNAKDISVSARVKLLLRYAGEYLRNPAYINSSLPAALTSYVAFYVTDALSTVRWIPFYHYVRWEEEDLLRQIRAETGWTSPEDTPLTWRIDDATAPFYNYLYYTIAGFTENDTFRSNQIREGAITRERALEIVKAENRPRLEAMADYLESVGLNYTEVKARVDAIPRLCGP